MLFCLGREGGRSIVLIRDDAERERGGLSFSFLSPLMGGSGVVWCV